MLSFQEFRNIRKTYLQETRIHCRKVYTSYVKQQKDKMNYPSTINIPCVNVDCFAAFDSEACPPAPKKLGFAKGLVVNKKEGINPMNYATATVQAGTTETQDQRKYLTRRLEDTYYTLDSKLPGQFGLHDDSAPRTPKEMKERLEKGMYVIRGLPKSEDEDDDDPYFYGWSDMIQWRDPAKKLDRDGYEAARKELKKAYQDGLDTVKIADVKDGLEAVKTLEAWEPTGAAN